MDKDAGIRSVAAGEQIFEQGGHGKIAFLVERGSVEIATEQGGRDLVIATLGPGEVFGEMALISNQPRNASARALEDTELTVITPERLQTVLNEADPLLTRLLRSNLGRFSWTQRFMLQTAGHSAGDVPLKHLAEEQERIEKAIHQGMLNEEFTLFYQPVIDTGSQKIAGFEALMRWQHPERGVVSPAEFMDVAENSGQIVSLGFRALEQALSDLKAFEQTLGTDAQELFMSVNLSARQLLDAEEVDRLVALIDESGVPARRVKLEITESLLVDDPEFAASALESLKAKGVRLAIDDFGTGYSSLSYLHLFPLHTLKVDRSFVSNMFRDDRRFSIVRAIVRLAKDLGLHIIAEGIETERERDTLCELQCDALQGFLLERPKPADDIHELLARNRNYW